MTDKRPTWGFTLNNWTPADKKLIEDWDKKYLCVGEEICPTTGTPHLQGWITFYQAKRLSSLKKLHKRIHWFIGESKDGMNYAMKDQCYIIQDNRRQGERTDLTAALVTLVNEGPKECVIQHPATFIRYHNGLQKAALFLMPCRKERPFVFWRYGPTGSGKTSYVYDLHGYDWVFRPKSFQWWDGYEQQQAVLFDDFRGEIKFNDLLQLLDRYPYKVEIKGGMMEFNSPFIYITSSKRPEELYHNCNDKIDQLLRRITEIQFIGDGREVTLGNTSTVTSPNYNDYLNIYN